MSPFWTGVLFISMIPAMWLVSYCLIRFIIFLEILVGVAKGDKRIIGEFDCNKPEYYDWRFDSEQDRENLRRFAKVRAANNLAVEPPETGSESKHA